jgi:hypothetical protein
MKLWPPGINGEAIERANVLRVVPKLHTLHLRARWEY